ncbi:MAG: anti-sigma factor family protein [Ktedonobacteraceae bacterium]
MNCHEVHNLIDGYIDDELDLVSNLDIEQHLQTCPKCEHLYRNRQALQTLIHTSPLSHKAPEHLQKRIQSSLRQADQPRRSVRRTAFALLTVAAVLLIAFITTWSIIRNVSAPSVDEPMVQSVLASHIRSLMVNHLVDVRSTDQHTVKPWFDGKLDYAPVVIDLAQQGYPLVGGRLDYLDNRPVAALVYQHETHVINLFTWPAASPTANSPVTTVTRQGYHMITWTQAGMVYWAVSDIEEDKLQTFVQLLMQQIS